MLTVLRVSDVFHNDGELIIIEHVALTASLGPPVYAVRIRLLLESPGAPGFDVGTDSLGMRFRRADDKIKMVT